jgi:hypothetical protein
VEFVLDQREQIAGHDRRSGEVDLDSASACCHANRLLDHPLVDLADQLEPLGHREEAAREDDLVVPPDQSQQSSWIRSPPDRGTIGCE